MTFILDKTSAGDVAQLIDHLPSIHRLCGLCSVSIKPNMDVPVIPELGKWSHDNQKFNNLQLHTKLETSLYYIKNLFQK